MKERLKAVPKPSSRYSKTIPPEMKGKISGAYRIDVERSVELAKVHAKLAMVPGIERKKWPISGVLLKSVPGWRLLPNNITELDCEERRDILSFVAAEKTNEEGEKEYAELPRIEAISIEIARIVLENIDEWNRLPQTTQFILEAEIIRMINADYKEFMEVDRAIKEHEIGKPTNLETMEQEAKEKVINKIVTRIMKLAEEFGETEAPTTKELKALAEETSRGVGKIIENPRTGILPPKGSDKIPTIPAGPIAIREAAKKK